MNQPELRTINDERTFSLKRFFFKWEWFLLLIFVAVNIMNSFISDHYLSVNGLFTATNSFLEKAFIALSMVFVLIIGEIDISVASIVALSSVVMAESYNTLQLPMGVALLVCLLVGTLCGFINGLILTRFRELAPMIVTLGTQILYRGIALIILGDRASGGFTSIRWYSNLYWGKIGPVPYMFIAFVVLAVIMGFILHKTTFGKRLFAIGSNRVAAKYSGIRVERSRLIVYTLSGLFSAITAIFLVARMGSTRPNVAIGYELDIISMCVLGGILTDGGKGNFVGAIISIFTLGFLRYGLGLINVQSQLMMVIIGTLLIVAVMVPNLRLRRNLKRD